MTVIKLDGGNVYREGWHYKCDMCEKDSRNFEREEFQTKSAAIAAFDLHKSRHHKTTVVI